MPGGKRRWLGDEAEGIQTGSERVEVPKRSRPIELDEVTPKLSGSHPALPGSTQASAIVLSDDEEEALSAAEILSLSSELETDHDEHDNDQNSSHRDYNLQEASQQDQSIPSLAQASLSSQTSSFPTTYSQPAQSSQTLSIPSIPISSSSQSSSSNMAPTLRPAPRFTHPLANPYASVKAMPATKMEREKKERKSSKPAYSRGHDELVPAQVKILVEDVDMFLYTCAESLIPVSAQLVPASQEVRDAAYDKINVILMKWNGPIDCIGRPLSQAKINGKDVGRILGLRACELGLQYMIPFIIQKFAGTQAVAAVQLAGADDKMRADYKEWYEGSEMYMQYLQKHFYKKAKEALQLVYKNEKARLEGGEEEGEKEDDGEDDEAMRMPRGGGLGVFGEGGEMGDEEEDGEEIGVARDLGGFDGRGHEGVEPGMTFDEHFTAFLADMDSGRGGGRSV